MTKTFTKAPVIPKGYDRLDYNRWMKYVTQQVNKLTGTQPDQRLIQK